MSIFFRGLMGIDLPTSKITRHCIILMCTWLSTLSFRATPQATNTQQAPSIIPPLLKKEDTVAIIAPAFGGVDSKIMQKAVELFQSWGLTVVLGKGLADRCGPLAGEDTVRREDVQRMLDDPTIRAIFTWKGGYGTTRIIDQLDFTQFLKHPKWVVGFSDITALLLHLHRLGVVTIHGELPSRFFLSPAMQPAIDSLKEVLFTGTVQCKAPPSTLNTIGQATGPVIGGNLTMICNSIGTPSEIDTQGKILVLEEIGEEYYHLDRMLVQLARANKLAHLAGLVVGSMFCMRDSGKNPFGKNAFEIIKEQVDPYHYPVAFNFPIGHAPPNVAFLHGGIGKLCITEKGSCLSFVLPTDQPTGAVHPLAPR